MTCYLTYTSDVSIVPSRTWSDDQSQSGVQPSLLGLTLRLCNPLETVSHVWMSWT